MNCTNKQQETAECEKRGCEGCFYNEKTADEMFSELGFKKKEKGQYIEYIKVNNSIREEYVISFMMETIMATLYVDGYIKKPLALEIRELQAINKKVQELGWIHEREEKENG